MQEIERMLGAKFGVLAESDTQELTVIAKNEDVAVGDLFVMPSRRGHERFYIFRTSDYANIMNRTIQLGDVARNKLTMRDSYLSEDLEDEKLIELHGSLLGYSEKEDGKWVFHRPRRLPDHLSDVYLIDESNSDAIKTLLGSQLGTEGICIGNLLAGEHPLSNVPVYLPPYAISHHIAIFGRTGCGKSNTMMVLIESMFKNNERVLKTGKGQKVSMLAIDPHDEFLDWHKKSGGRGGIGEITGKYSADEKAALVDPYFYLTPKQIDENGGMARIRISRADIIPEDLISITEFSEQQSQFAGLMYSLHGELWISKLLSGDLGDDPAIAQYMDATKGAVERRVSFLRNGQTKVFTSFDPEVGYEYDSILPELVCALEKGRIITIDTTLMTEMEQFLLTTLVARVLFVLRKALKAARGDEASLKHEIKLAFGVGANGGNVGSKSLVDKLLEALDHGDLPYLNNGVPVAIDTLPHINFVIEEAPSVLNPERIRFGSIFRDISRQGRKFQIGLTVISQQVTAIDEGILTQVNTEITMALGNETERREAIRNASADLFGFEKELQVMGKGQAILTASYKDVPLPVQAPLYDSLEG